MISQVLNTLQKLPGVVRAQDGPGPTGGDLVTLETDDPHSRDLIAGLLRPNIGGTAVNVFTHGENIRFQPVTPDDVRKELGAFPGVKSATTAPFQLNPTANPKIQVYLNGPEALPLMQSMVRDQVQLQGKTWDVHYVMSGIVP